MKFQRIMRRMAVPSLVIIGAVGIVAALGALKPRPETVEEETRTPTVFVAVAKGGGASLTVEAQGEVRAKTEINLTTQVAGRIIMVSPRFVEGGLVEPGDTLLRVDPSDYELALTQAEAGLAEAKLSYDQERASQAMAQRQWSWDELKDSDAPTPLALKEPHVARALANLRSAQAMVDKAKRDLQRTQLTVPFAGRVRAKSADLGQFVGIGTSVGEVFSTEIVEIPVTLTSTQLAKLGVSFAFSAEYDEAPLVTLSTEIAGESQEWQGRLVRTAASIDSSSRLIRAFVEVRDPYAGGTPLPVGAFVNASIEGRFVDEGVTIPRTALLTRDRVYVIDKDDKLNIRSVEVAATTDTMAVISAGLKDGERVATSPIASPIEGRIFLPTLEAGSGQFAGSTGSAGDISASE